MTIKKLRDKITKLERVGTQMSNLLYGWKQQDYFSPDTRRMMDELVRKWDAEVRSEP